MHTRILFLLVITAVFSSCTGYNYAAQEVLTFDEIDYDFSVKFSQTSPKIAYVEEGSGDIPILLVHGLASNAGFWRYAIPGLSARHKVIAVDLPGYGKSEKGNLDYGMAYWANELKDFMHALGHDNFIYVGHSMGGQIGFTLALNHPESVHQLILLSPAGVEKFKPGEGKWLSGVITMAGVVLTDEENVRINLDRNFYRWSDEFEWMVEERVRMAKDEAAMQEFAYTVDRSVDAMLDEPTSDRLADITVPTTIIHGKYDGLIPNPFLHPGKTADVFEKAIKVIPGSNRIEIDEAGHMVQIEQPQAFVEAVLKSIR